MRPSCHSLRLKHEAVVTTAPHDRFHTTEASSATTRIAKWASNFGAGGLAALACRGRWMRRSSHFLAQGLPLFVAAWHSSRFISRIDPPDGFSLLHHDGISQTWMGAGHVLAFFEGTAHRIYSGVTVTPSTPLPAGSKFFSPAHALGSSRRSPPCRDCIDCLGERGIYYHSPVRTDHTRSLVILTVLFSTFKKHHLYTITQRKPLPW